MKLKNKKTNVVKDVEEAFVGDYLSTKEWEIVEEKKETSKNPKQA